MKKIFPMFLCVLIYFCAFADESPDSPKTPSQNKSGDIHLFTISWGIKTKTKQVWDGSVKVREGTITSVVPFQRNEKPTESMLESESSWHSTTYIDVEGIFLFVRGNAGTMISISTKSGDFSFNIGDVKKGEIISKLGGEVQIRNDSGKVLFRIVGLEKGIPGKGTATITPNIARANSLGTWVLTYSAPEEGIPVGGGIRISWHFTRSWGTPQFKDPGAKNFVTVKTTGDCRLDYTSEHMGIFEYPYSLGRILVRVFDKPLLKGEKIIVTLGDKSGGCPGFEAPVIREEKDIIRVEDCTEIPEGVFPIYRRLREVPFIRVFPSEPRRFFVVAPSIVQKGVPFDLKATAEDEFRNVVSDLSGEIGVWIDANPVKKERLSNDKQSPIRIENLVLDSTGPHWITVKLPEHKLAGESNPILCVEEKPENILVWGELHGHSEHSDGYNTADDYFNFARNNALLDFAALSDHDVELDAPDYLVSQMWEWNNIASKKHNAPPEFCTLPAYEWSPGRETGSTTAPFGDHNVYYEKEGNSIFQAFSQESSSLPKLYERLKEIKDCEVQAIPHVGGAVSNWEYFDQGLENLCEIHSVHGSFEEFGKKYLDMGYMVGFVGAADSHNGRIGGFPPGSVPGHYAHGGLTAVFVPDLSRKSLFDAFKKRSVYATSGDRIFVDFRIIRFPMGSLFVCDVPPSIYVRVMGTAPLLFVELVKNGKVINRWENEYEYENRITLLWNNRIEKENIFDFDNSLWSYHLRFVNWQGGIKVNKGDISLRDTCSFDYPKDRILTQEKNKIHWSSETRGDWDGISFSITDQNVGMDILLGNYNKSISASELEMGMNTIILGESDSLIVIKGIPEKRDMVWEITDNSILYRWNYYYLRVIQINGEMAWSSPIWIQKN
jgi:hypothetical protein